MKYEIETPFPVDTYASDRAVIANNFRTKIIADYIAMYENFWAIGREEVGMEQMQAILDRLGMVGIQILTDAGTFVMAIETAFKGELPEKYHSAPYEYTIEAPGRIVLTELKKAWQPVEPEEENES